MKSLLVTVLAILPLSLLTGCSTHQSPTGRSQTLLFSAAEINTMGDDAFTAIKKQQTISQDKGKTEYVTCVAKRLISVLPNQGIPWEVVLFDSKEVNAFALPGGHIGVYTGLLNVAKNAEQLAAVMGHEIAHVLARHGNEQMSRAQLAGLGLQLSDAVLVAHEISQRDVYMSALGVGVQVGLILPFSRAQEDEADVMGLELMARAGFNPAQGVELWRNMAKVGGTEPPEFLSTHPSNATRIAHLQQLQGQVQPLYVSVKGKPFPNCSLLQSPL